MRFFYKTIPQRYHHFPSHNQSRARGPQIVFLVTLALLSGCAGKYIDIPRPSSLSSLQTSTVIVAAPDTSYRELVLSTRLRDELINTPYYRVMTDHELQKSLGQAGQSLENIWKSPKLARELKADVVIAPNVLSWEVKPDPVERRIVSDTGKVVQYCSKVLGTVTSRVTLWNVQDGQQLFEDTVTASHSGRECADNPVELQGRLNALMETTAPSPSKSAPDPLFERAIKKAVAVLVDDLDPNPVRPVYIFVFDGTGRQSGRKLLKARELLRDDNWAGAIRVLEENLKTYPDSYASIYLIGVAQQAQRNFDSAIKSYQRAWQLCKIKFDTSSPEKAPHCSHFEEAFTRSQAWGSSMPSKPSTEPGKSQ